MPDESQTPSDAFRTTRWSLVHRAAGAAGLTVRGEALSELLKRYLPALRSHLVARLRIPPDRADDLLQAFIVKKVLEYDLLARADQQRGKFRTLLLTSLDNFVRNEFARRSRDSGQELQDNVAADVSSQPGRDFDVPWARALLEQAIAQMRAECSRNGRDDLWHVFEARVLGPTLRDEPPVDYLQLVQRFSLRSPAHASNILMTAKRMFERTLRSLVAEYAADDGEIDEEITSLREVLSHASQ